jgi:hypothetical protein
MATSWRERRKYANNYLTNAVLIHMDDIEQAILSAWSSVKDRILFDPAELRRRLERMQRPSLAKVPRVWTVALRAGDTRLRSPVVEFRPREADETQAGGRCGRHEVSVDRQALITLGRPVDVAGCTVHEAARRLGVNPQNLLHGRLKGTFDVRYVRGLEGRPGKPRPILTAKHWLDPTTRGFDSTEPAWRWAGQFDATRIPKIEQTLVRVSHFQVRGGSKRYRDTAALHPEHPAVAGEDGMDVARKRRDKRLPKPPPDNAWYKWKGDEYVGYDWRKRGAKEAYERHERQKELSREGQRRRRAENPPPMLARGSLEFKGWRWLCPCCQRAVQILYLPLERVNLITLNDPVARDELEKNGEPVDTPPRGLASAACHRVTFLARGKKDFWGEVIAHLTGGLLYGAEVKRLDVARVQRKRPYAPRPNATPAWRRPMVQERLLKGWSYKRIAADMGITTGTVDTHAQAIYRQHRVHGRAELVRLLGAAPEVALTHWRDVRAMRGSGWTQTSNGAIRAAPRPLSPGS